MVTYEVSNLLTTPFWLCIHCSGDILCHAGRGGNSIWTERDWCHTSCHQCGIAWDKAESEIIHSNAKWELSLVISAVNRLPITLIIYKFKIRICWCNSIQQIAALPQMLEWIKHDSESSVFLCLSRMCFYGSQNWGMWSMWTTREWTKRGFQQGCPSRACKPYRSWACFLRIVCISPTSYMCVYIYVYENTHIHL